MKFPGLCPSYMANDGGLASAAKLCRASISAFSSEVGTGSREENASKQKTEAGSVLISIRTDPASGRDGYEISVMGRKRPLRVRIPVLRPTLRRREPGHPGEARPLITAMENTE
jgi:hypothetical protein